MSDHDELDERQVWAREVFEIFLEAVNLPDQPPLHDHRLGKTADRLEDRETVRRI